VFGLMESEAKQPFAVGDDAWRVARQLMAAAAVNGLRYNFPVNVADRLRDQLLPLMSEITSLAVRLSMTGDTQIHKAAIRLSNAATSLVQHMFERDRRYARRETELEDALRQLRRTRDAANARWWRRRKLRRAIR
jgi:hypothetical protein